MLHTHGSLVKTEIRVKSRIRSYSNTLRCKPSRLGGDRPGCSSFREKQNVRKHQSKLWQKGSSLSQKGSSSFIHHVEWESHCLARAATVILREEEPSHATPTSSSCDSVIRATDRCYVGRGIDS